MPTQGPRKGKGRPSKLSNILLLAMVPLMALIFGARADLLRNGQSTGPLFAYFFWPQDFRLHEIVSVDDVPCASHN